jgi:predicted nuclease with TOPRIM domain
VLNERSGQQQAMDWMSDVAAEAVKEYLAAADANPETAKLLEAAFVLRSDLKKLRDEADKLRAEQQQLEQGTEETRDNLKAIEKNKAAEDLRKTLTNRLAKSSARLDVVMKRLIELELQTKELELRFHEAIKDVRISPRG